MVTLTFRASLLSTEYIPTWSSHYTSMPSTCPLPYHHVLNRGMCHGLATREKIWVIKESIYRGMRKTAQTARHVSRISLCQACWKYCVYQCLSSWNLYSGLYGTIIYLKFKVHTLKFFQNVPAISEIQKQSALKHAFNSAFARVWWIVFTVGQVVPVPTRTVLFEVRR